MDDGAISNKIKSLELEGLRLRNQVQNILHESFDDQSSQPHDSIQQYKSLCTDNTPSLAVDTINNHASHVKRKSQNGNYNISGYVSEVDDFNKKHKCLQRNPEGFSSFYQLEKERLFDDIEQLKGVNFKLLAEIEDQQMHFKTLERDKNYVIECLRYNISQLLCVNKKQEEALIESGERIALLNDAETSVTAIEQLRNLLVNVDNCRESNLNKDNDIESLAPNTLVNLVEKYFTEFHSDNDINNCKIKKLEENIIRIKKCLTDDRERSVDELRRQLDYVEQQNRCLVQHFDEVNEQNHCELERLKDQNTVMELKMEHDVAQSLRIIADLERNIEDLTITNNKHIENWTIEKTALECDVNALDTQISLIRVERDQAINQNSTFTAKLEATLSQLSETEANLLTLQSEKYSSGNEVESLKKRMKEMELGIISSRSHFENIFESICACTNTCRQDYELDCNEGGDGPDFWKPKSYQIEAIIHGIKTISKRLNDLDYIHTSLKKEYKMSLKQLEISDVEKQKFEQMLSSQQDEIERAFDENSHVNSLIASRNNEIERLTAERDYYFQTLNEKTDQLATVRSEKHRLEASLKDRCRKLEAEDCVDRNSKSNIIDTSVGKNQIIREERNRISLELKELKSAYETLLDDHNKTNLNLERTIHENRALQTELKNVRRDYDELTVENKRFSIKLKDSEYEINNLCRDLQSNQGVKSKKHLNLEKKIAELNSELISYKSELKLSNERMKCIDRGGSNSGSRVFQSGKLISLMDLDSSLENVKLPKTRLDCLEQQVLVLETSQKNLKSENRQLTDLLKRITSQNERMSEELENYIVENKKLQDEVNKSSIDYTYIQKKNEKLSKKLNQLFGSGDHQLQNPRQHLYNETENESIKLLRDDLQSSIKEAKKLLSNTPWIDQSKEARNDKTCSLHKFKDISFKITDLNQ